MNSVESEHVGVYDENETLVATAYRYNQSHSAKPYSDNYYVGKYNENGDIFTLFCDNGLEIVKERIGISWQNQITLTIFLDTMLSPIIRVDRPKNMLKIYNTSYKIRFLK